MAWVKRIALTSALTLSVGFVGVQTLANQADVSSSVHLVAFAPSTTSTVAPHRVTPVAPTTSTTAAPAPPPPVVTTTAPPVTKPAPVREAALAKTPDPAPKPAPAPAPPPPPPPTTPASVGAAALQLVNYPWQKLGYGLSFEGPNTGLLGKTDCGTHQVTIYVRPTQTVRQVAFVTAFELGHAVDCGTMNDTRRAEWAAIRGFAPGWTWFPGCLCTEDNFGSGDISMVFANWLVPNSGYRWRSNLAPAPSAAQLQQLLPYLRPASIG